MCCLYMCVEVNVEVNSFSFFFLVLAQQDFTKMYKGNEDIQHFKLDQRYRLEVNIAFIHVQFV